MLISAFGLNDSPVGLAAYILEKFSLWTNLENRFWPDGNLTKAFTLDELLTNVMIYWVTGSIGSSMRFYRETFHSEFPEWDRLLNYLFVKYTDHILQNIIYLIG